MARKEIRYAKIEDLRKGMRIHSFDSFHRRFHSMDQQTRDWLKLNFKGASCIINRKNKKMGLLVDKLQIGDSLLRVHKLPQNLKKLTIVNDKLIAALEKRGFLGFGVSDIQIAPKQLKRREDIQKTEAFFKDIEDATGVKNEAADVIEDLMNKTRKGETNILQLMKYVDVITEETSPQAMSVISALKQSDKTYAHCIDVGVIFQTVYHKIVEKNGLKSPFTDANETLMGGFMHDFGKSKIPKDIVDNTELFDPEGEEMAIIRTHPELGAELLAKMRMPNHIINLAKNHHVKQDMSLTASYPKISDYSSLSIEDRLLSIVDMYQALVGRRQYKKSWAPPGAISYMDQLAGIELDMNVWEDFAIIMGRYPVGSLVLLSNDYQAFVSDINSDDPNRPQLVVIQDDKGERLTRNEFLDLKFERDISIKKGLDHFDVFGDRSLEVFLSLKLI